MRIYHQAVISIIALVALLVSCEGCGNRLGFLTTNSEETVQVRQLQNLVDSLVDENPDTVLYLLRRDSALVQKAGKAERMIFNLLKAYVEDYFLTSHESDSMAQELVAYFERHGNAREKVQAYYILGSVYCRLHLDGSAIVAYNKALDVKEDEDPATFTYKAKAAKALGSAHAQEGDTTGVLQYYETACNLARKSNNPAIQVFALLYTAEWYRVLDKTEQAEYYYKKAEKLARRFKNQRLHDRTLIELALHYVIKGDLEKTKETLSQFSGHAFFVDWAPYYSVLRLYHQGKGDRDSVIYYYKKQMEYSSAPNRQWVARDLARLYAQRGDLKTAISYYERQITNADSVESNNNALHRDLMKYAENVMLTERAKAKLTQDRLYLVILLLSLALVSVVAFFLFWQFYKRRRTQNAIQHQRIKAYWANLHQQDKTKLKETNEQVKQLKKELATKPVVIESRTKETLAATLVDDNSKTATEEQYRRIEMLVNSTIYQQFHQVDFTPREKDFKALEQAVNETFPNFTHRLKHLYPAINETEMRICCLLKIGIDLKVISIFLSIYPSSLSLYRRRLYQRLFHAEGKPSDLDRAIECL